MNQPISQTGNPAAATPPALRLRTRLVPTADLVPWPRGDGRPGSIVWPGGSAVFARGTATGSLGMNDEDRKGLLGRIVKHGGQYYVWRYVAGQYRRLAPMPSFQQAMAMFG